MTRTEHYRQCLDRVYEALRDAETATLAHYSLGDLRKEITQLQDKIILLKERSELEEKENGKV